MRRGKRSLAGFVMLAAGMAIATMGGVIAASSEAGNDEGSILPAMSVFSQPSASAAMADARMIDLASTLDDRADLSLYQLLGDGLGRFDSRLVAFPSESGRTICYALLGRTDADPGLSYCFQPLASDLPSSLAGQRFHAVALESIVNDLVGVQLFGIAFDDVVAIRAQVQGEWRAIPVENNAFYLDLPGVRHDEVGVVEATLTDGSTQYHDIQTGG